MDSPTETKTSEPVPAEMTAALERLDRLAKRLRERAHYLEVSAWFLAEQVRQARQPYAPPPHWN